MIGNGVRWCKCKLICTGWQAPFFSSSSEALGRQLAGRSRMIHRICWDGFLGSTSWYLPQTSQNKAPGAGASGALVSGAWLRGSSSKKRWTVYTSSKFLSGFRPVTSSLLWYRCHLVQWFTFELFAGQWLSIAVLNYQREQVFKYISCNHLRFHDKSYAA